MKVGSTITPTRRSVIARLHSRILDGVCREGVFQMVMMTRKLRVAATIAVLDRNTIKGITKLG
jgi:hypothetical protein